ncbi:MAG: hypothetical protein KY445_02780, partial [Armatimonadetes bacterium]|nr:hypothetical protein [Armatimonadota bacterium]
NNAGTGFPRGMKMGRILGGSTVYQLGWLEDLYNNWVRVVKAAKAENDERIAAARTESEKERLRREFARRAYHGELHSELDFIRFDSTENPAFPQSEFDAMRLSLPEWMFDMRYRAIFRKPAGVIYDGFDPAKHVIPRFPIPKEWEKMGAIDFGRQNFYATLWAHDADRDRHFLYDSYHRTDLDLPGHGAQLLKEFPDVDRWVAGQISEHAEREQLASGGLGTLPPMFRPLWPGINNLNAAFRLNKVFIFDDVARDSDGVNEIVSEIKSYSRPVDESGEVLLDSDPEDKETFHWLDTGRYRGTYYFAGLSTGEIKASARTAEVQVGTRGKPQSEETNRRELSDGVGIYAGGGMSQNSQTMRRYKDVYDPLM